MWKQFILTELVQFAKNVWGSIQKPYSTYRELIQEDPLQLLIIFTLIAIYFFFISPIKLHTLHPFLLTLNTTRLFTTTLTAFLGIVLFFVGVGKLLGHTPRISSVLLAWGYALIPTLVWFFTTSIFYLLLPPPRHETIPGRIFSILFFAFSLSLFFWKGLLYYLTLRFALKLDLVRIIGVSLVFFPLLTLYSWWMYSLGIFRVPFV